MMSSEEEADCFGLYGDKLSKKAKRARQRVDAGEPRNSYSSIPNFSSRPSFFTGGLYGAFFQQNQQQFGIFGPGFAPKMLNELLGRQVKDAATPGDTMMTMDSDNFDCSTVIRRGLEDNGSPPPGDIAHHMLRDILQGRKKELLALEQELRVVNALGGTEPPSPDNNNSINNNNNNELKNGAVTNNGEVSEDCGKDSMVNGGADSDSGDDEQAGEDQSGPQSQDPRASEDAVQGSDSEPGSPTPQDDTEENSGNKDTSIKTEQIELKRARVENIVSSMRSSPSLPTQVNGCKKRKRYHPQQHDNSAAERYAALGINMNAAMLIDDDEEDEVEPNEIRQKRVEKDALKTQLRTMQEQLAEMQQKYVQLCTRMDQESECQDNDDASSDMEQEVSNLTIPDKPATSSSASTPVKDNITNTPASTPVSQPIMSPAISKMLPSKLHPPPHLPQHLPIPPTFNGALSLLQQQVLQEQQHGPPHGPLPHHHLHPHPQMNPHHALSNAAAMYLGVSHKLYMEQEARMKEVAMAAEQHQHQQHMSQQHHGHQQHMMSHHQQQQQSGHQQQAPQPPQQQIQQQQQGSQTPHSQPSTPHPPNPTQSSTQTQPSTPHQNQHPQSQTTPQPPPQSKTASDFAERLSILRNQALAPPVSGSDLEGLADVLKTEITTSLSNLIDSIMSRFVQQRRFFGKQSEAAAVAAEQLNKDLLLASQLLDRKSPRSKVVDRGNQGPPERTPSGSMNGSPQAQGGPPRLNGTAFPSMPVPQHHQNSSNNSNNNTSNPENNINTMNLPHIRSSLNQAMFQPPKPPTSSMNSAVVLYNNMNSMAGNSNPYCVSDSREGAPEQNEALSLVVVPKKKRHKVTDTRITPRTVSRILAQDGIGTSPQGNLDSSPKFNMIPSTSSSGGDSPPPRPYHPPPPPMLPVSLPTSVAIPNPSLHESQVFSPYSPFYGPHHQPPHIPSASPPGMGDLRDSPPLHPPTLLHPALLAAAQHGSPDYGGMRAPSAGLGGANDSVDRSSDCNSGDGPYDGITPTDSPRNGIPMTLSYGLTYEASSLAYLQKLGYAPNANDSSQTSLPKDGSLTEPHSSTLTPMHLRKAKLMFFWVRYPSSAVLKMYFPDIKFNKNNTAQLVKWFSNFREFYYIQMEKYARQAVSEGVKSAEDLHVSGDCEIYRVLNLHYNRNNHIEVPPNFRYVVEQTLKEFFKAIQSGKDTEQSWKKSIYKIISRMDDPVPEYFKSPNFLEQLE
ncbi:homeobox protein prospero isoform X2 [Macrosteles quadrilineatus]|uniref:homeobox protein prospero isoform X2 n=1 Tax=Macrosteles quadrilineatus TaxID=74068 RepID=UPI0023E1244B|nr:homeobox protein prospero isoform X2 [Macrosteles quadrilineatus]